MSELNKGDFNEAVAIIAELFPLATGMGAKERAAEFLERVSSPELSSNPEQMADWPEDRGEHPQRGLAK